MIKQTGDEEGVPGACVRLTVGTVATTETAGKSIHQRMPLGRIHRPNPEIIGVLDIGSLVSVKTGTM